MIIYIITKNKIMKFLFYLLMPLLCINLITSCEYYYYAKGVKEDTERQFRMHKNFLLGFRFNGIVKAKQECESCSDDRVDKYSIFIQLVQVDSIALKSAGILPTIFADFKMPKLFKLPVKKDMFYLIHEQDSIIKDANSYFIKFRNHQFQLLSKEEGEWFPKI